MDVRGVDAHSRWMHHAVGLDDSYHLVDGAGGEAGGARGRGRREARAGARWSSPRTSS